MKNLYRQSSTILGQSAAQIVAPTDTSENVLATISVTNGIMTGAGCIRWDVVLSTDNNANAKTLRIRLGGIGGSVLFTRSITSTTGNTLLGRTCNRNSASSQYTWLVTGSTHGGGVFASGAPTVTSVDTTSTQSLVITMQKATGADAVALEAYSVELVK